MKKFVILLSVLFAFSFGLKAQVMDTDEVLFNVYLLETFTIEVIDGDEQFITFAVPADYNSGVTEGAGIVTGTSTVVVNATGNWDILIGADHFMPVGTEPGFIPIDNLGFWIVSTGTYQFGTELSLPFANTSPETSIAMFLTGGEETIIGNGTGSGNAGSGLENLFVFHWEMGTRRTNPLAPMNPVTMFTQLGAGDFGIGEYSTVATLTLRKL